MKYVEIPLSLLLKIVNLAEAFGEPCFMVIEGAGDGGENGVESGRVAVFDAELAWVADYKPDEVAQAERLRDLLNAVAGDLAGFVTSEHRRNASEPPQGGKGRG